MNSSEARAPLSPTCLFPDEAEIARLILGPKRVRMWPALATVLERQGLPKVDPMFGGRYWPKVRLFLDDMNGMDDDMTLYHVARPEVTPPGDRTGGVRPRIRERNRR